MAKLPRTNEGLFSYAPHGSPSTAVVSSLEVARVLATACSSLLSAKAFLLFDHTSECITKYELGDSLLKGFLVSVDLFR